MYKVGVIFSIFFAASLTLCVGGEQASSRLQATFSWERNPIMKHVNAAGRLKLRNLRLDVRDNGCDMNLCFLLDANSVVTEEDFSNQKNFADLLIAITSTDSGGNFCGVLHSKKVTQFSGLTGDKNLFLQKLHALELEKLQVSSARQAGSSKLFFAMWYTMFRLLRQRGDANKIIAFSKTRPSVSARFANWILTLFRRRNGGVCAVALVGSIKKDLAVLTGDVNKVVTITKFFDLAEIIVAMVSDVCAMPCKTRYGRRGPMTNKLKPMRSCPNGSTQ